MIRRRIRRFAILAPVVISTAVSAQSGSDWSLDLRAKDAVDVFAGMCVLTRGNREKAMTMFGSGVPGASRLSDAVVQAAQGGRTGGVAWVIHSPNNAMFMLEYNPVGLCGVRLIEADEKSVQIAFEALSMATAAVAKSPLIKAPAKTRNQDGAKITLEDYSFAVPGHTEHLTLSTSDHKVAAQQHYLTLAFSKPDK